MSVSDRAYSKLTRQHSDIQITRTNTKHSRTYHQVLHREPSQAHQATTSKASIRALLNQRPRRSIRGRSPLLVIMLYGCTQHSARMHKYKWLAVLLCALICLQYMAGLSVYQVDVNIWRVTGDRLLQMAHLRATTTSAPSDHDPVVLDQIDAHANVKISTVTQSPHKVVAEEIRDMQGANEAKVDPTMAILMVAETAQTDNGTWVNNRSEEMNATDSAVVGERSTVTTATTVSTSTVTTVINADGSVSGAPFKAANAQLDQCAAMPPVLVGAIKVWFDYPSFNELALLYPYLEPGGHGKPANCVSNHRVAIIIPYRDRQRHLRGFLHNLHSLLTKQQLDYTIFVVEQIANQTFNRAKLMNVGFVEANRLYDWQCYIFHDVDLLPQDDRNLYTCPEQPRHMSVGVDKFNYKLPYGSIFGGITALTRQQFQTVNGYPNDYWGWGGEDDDMSERVTINKYKISRYPPEISRYKMIKHSHESSNAINKCRFKLLSKTKKRWKNDGLNSLKYKLLAVNEYPLYTSFTVDLFETESKSELEKAGFTHCRG